MVYSVNSNDQLCIDVGMLMAKKQKRKACIFINYQNLPQILLDDDDSGVKYSGLRIDHIIDRMIQMQDSFWKKSLHKSADELKEFESKAE
jgi:hypothetical protein